MDKELQKVTRDAVITKRHVDKLAKVCRKSGEERWVMAHIDVQSQHEKQFPKRLFIYNYRIFDRYDQPVATFAIYADKSKKWKPNHHKIKLWGTKIRFDFATVKLLDYDILKLEASDNPFAVVVLAHLQTKATHNQVNARYKTKINLTKMLYERGYSKKKILSLYRYIDWMMALPSELEEKLTAEITKYEETNKMSYVTNAERIGYRRGVEKGLAEGRKAGREAGIEKGIKLEQQATLRSLLNGVKVGLQVKFGTKGLELLSEIRKINDVDMLYAIQEAIIDVKSVSELQHVYQPAIAGM